MLADYIQDHAEWSFRTFGPGRRTKGLTAHIRKELIEVEKEPTDLMEWVDIMILAIDGAVRAGHSSDSIVCALMHKQRVNMARNYPMPKSEDEPSEHVRESEDGRDW